MAEQAGVDAVECNFSCPQTTLPETGNKVGIDYELVKKFVAATRKGTKLPIVAKMTPNITSLNEISKVCLENGATAISLINTVKSIISIDLETYVPAPNVNGFSCVSGMSGKSVKPIGLRFMSELNLDSELKKFSPEYSGIGGVYS
jgi:dihydropyrimidine dehydrogenase (NAD+) subunit PreA